MTYTDIRATRSEDSRTSLSTRAQERRILQYCVVFALSALLLFVLFPSMRAQDVFTDKQVPSIGTKYRLKKSAATDIDPQPGGELQFWDFSFIPEVPKFVDSVTTVDPSGMIGALPNTNVVVTHTQSARRIFYNTGKSSLNYLGEDNTQQQIVVGSNPLDIEPIPVKLNTQIVRQYNAQINFPLIPTQTVKRGANVVFEPDGTGSLLLPSISGTTEVVRVHWTERYDDTLLIKSKAQYIAHSTIERYVWYGANDPVEYLSIRKGNVTFTKLSLTPPPDSTIDETLFLMSLDAVSDVSDAPDLSLSVYPLPARAVLHVSSPTHSTGRLRAELFSLEGELLVGVEAATDHENGLSIPISSLANQSAILKVYDGSGVRVRKVMIVH